MFLPNAPMTYEVQNAIDYFSVQPSQVKGNLNQATAYYKWLLMKIIMYVYIIKIPSRYALNYFRYWLFYYGSIANIYTKKFGYIMSNYSVSMIDLYFQPKQIVASNQFLDEPKVGLIGVNAEIIKIFDDYTSFVPIVNAFASRLAACDKGVDINLMVSCMGKLLGVPNKKIADTIKEALGDLTTGQPYVTVNTTDLENTTINQAVSDLAGDFHADKIQELKRSIMNEFLTVVGINNANINKRERLNSDEVNANNQEVKAICTLAYEGLKESFERCSKLTGENYSVELRDANEIREYANSLIGGGLDG